MHNFMKHERPGKCAFCYGEGVISGIAGPQPCPDCGGLGALPSSNTLDEVRRGRHALIQILVAARDAEPADGVASRVSFLANGAMGLYPVDPE